MRNFRVMSGQAMAVAASLVLVTACGGSDGEFFDPATTTTTSTEATTSTTVTTTTSTTAPGQVVNNGVQFANRNTSFCLRETETGAVVHSNCFSSGDPNQYWKLTQFGNNFTITNNATNKCLSIAAGSKDDLAAAATVDCDGSQQTLWTMPPSGTTANDVNLVNVNSGKCLEIQGGPNSNLGGPITQFTCGATQPQANQTWLRTVITP